MAYPCHACGDHLSDADEVCPTCGAAQVSGDTARLTAVSGRVEGAPERSNTSPLHPVARATPVVEVEEEAGEEALLRHDTAPYPAVIAAMTEAERAHGAGRGREDEVSGLRPTSPCEANRPRVSTLKDPRLQAAFERGLALDIDEPTLPASDATQLETPVAFDTEEDLDLGRIEAASAAQRIAFEPTDAQEPPTFLGTPPGSGSGSAARVADHRLEPTMREVSPVVEGAPPAGGTGRPRVAVREPAGSGREASEVVPDHIVVPKSPVAPHRPAPLTSKIALPDDDLVVAGKTPVGLWIAILLALGLGVGVLAGAFGLYLGWFDGPMEDDHGKAHIDGADAAESVTAAEEEEDAGEAESDSDEVSAHPTRRRRTEAEVSDAGLDASTARDAEVPDDVAAPESADVSPDVPQDTASPVEVRRPDAGRGDAGRVASRPDAGRVAARPDAGRVAARADAGRAPLAGGDPKHRLETQGDGSELAAANPASATFEVSRVYFEPKRLSGFVHGKADVRKRATRSTWEAIQIGGIDVLILTGDRRGDAARVSQTILDGLEVALVRHARGGGEVVSVEKEGKVQLVWRAKGADPIPLMVLDPVGVAELAKVNRRAFGEFTFARHLAAFLTDVFDLVALGKAPSRVADPAFRAVARRVLALAGRVEDRLATISDEERAVLNRTAWMPPFKK